MFLASITQPPLIRLRRSLVLVFDGAIAGASLWTSMLLRFEGQIPHTWSTRLPELVLLLVACRVSASMILRLHRWSFNFSGLTDGVRIGISGLLGSGLFLLGVYLLRLSGPPRSVVVLELLLSTAAMAFVRFSPRLASLYRADRARSRRPEALRALIVGAGAAGDMLLRDLRQSHEHSYVVCGFVDDDRSRHGSIVGGKPVLGTVADLPRLVKRHRVTRVLIAIPRLPAQRIREILNLCSDLKLQFKILPVSFVYLQERGASSMLEDLSPEDLLPREPVRFVGEDLQIAGRTALVTGGAGSIGSEICRQLLHSGAAKVIMVDINENGLYLLKRRLTPAFPDAAVIAEVANVRESKRLRNLFARYEPQDVFHAAAHKQVPLMEIAPAEAVKNNVLGTLNVAQAASEVGCERFILISTDKAVRPTSVMGATKQVAEMVVRRVAERSDTHFCTVRFGNVLNSAGSVIPIFREQIAAGGPVTVTHPEVRRYLMTIEEAVGLVLKSAYGDYGPLCILEMGQLIRILDLARQLIILSGRAPEVDIPIVFTGLRPGEKLYEELFTDAEEKTQRVDEKILAADASPPPGGFDESLRDLLDIAARDNSQAVLAALRSLVPFFREIPQVHEPTNLAAI